MPITHEILQKAILFIDQYYKAHFSTVHCFHNVERARQIVRNSNIIAAQMNVDAEAMLQLNVAAWFLETGYAKDAANYQDASATIAETFLLENNVDDTSIQQVKHLILATKPPQQPMTLSQQVLCDSVAFHLAEKNVLQHLANYHQEECALKHEGIGKEQVMKEWRKQMKVSFFFTPAAKTFFDEAKQKNRKRLKKEMEGTQAPEGIVVSSETIVVEKEKKEKLINTKLERGVDTFFRVSEKRHMELSRKAHDKASLLISVNSIVMSIVLSVLFTQLSTNKFLLLPTLILVLSCVTTIILSIISTRPRLIKSNDHHHQENGNHKEFEEVNILFFGDFSKLSLTEYKQAVENTYHNNEKLYESLTRDIYYQGILLNWKFKYINIAYNVFMYGFIATVIAFITAYWLHTS
jgi:predicted metal-dependent HD superfamily phosphohydrolase